MVLVQRDGPGASSVEAVVMMQPQPAATVMIARDGAGGIEVFLVRRSPHSPFMPDVFVFPGGRVDDEDRAPAALARIRGSVPALDPAYIIAAARETFEEAGLLLAARAVAPQALEPLRHELHARTRTFVQILVELDTDIDAGALRYFSHWITPPGESRRFDTHFFLARAPAGQTAAADAVETFDGRWIAPAEALARCAAGDLALILPTIKHLERLSGFSDVGSLLDYARTKPIHPVVPAAGGGGNYVVPPGLGDRW